MSPSGPSYGAVAVFSTTFEGILYGFSFLMFVLTIWVITTNYGLSTWHHKAMFVAAGLLFVISTIHMAVNIDHLYEGFVRHSNEPSQYLANVSTRTFVFKDVAYVAQILVGDAVVIFRAYVVWQSFKIILLPIALYVALIVSSFGSIYTLASAKPPQAYDIFQDSTGIWIKLHLAATLTCNFISTCLLAYRLWIIERSVAELRSNPQNSLMPILRVVIDSGLLYSFTLISALICFATESRAEYLVYDIVTPIISISFYAVILRVSIVHSRWPSTLITRPQFLSFEERLSGNSSRLRRNPISPRISTKPSMCEEAEASETSGKESYALGEILVSARRESIEESRSFEERAHHYVNQGSDAHIYI